MGTGSGTLKVSRKGREAVGWRSMAFATPGPAPILRPLTTRMALTVRSHELQDDQIRESARYVCLSHVHYLAVH